MRKRHPVTKSATWEWWQAPASRNIQWLIMSNLMASRANGKPVFEYLPEKYRNLQWTVRPESIQGYENAKLEAMRKYETQYKMLGGDGMFTKILPQYHKYWGGAEPYWYAQDMSNLESVA